MVGHFLPCAAQVQNATSAVKQGGHVTVTLPPAVYNVTSTLVISSTQAGGSFTLQGQGAVLDCGGRASLALYVTTVTSVAISDLTVRNCGLRGSKGTPTHTIQYGYGIQKYSLEIAELARMLHLQAMLLVAPSKPKAVSQ